MRRLVWLALGFEGPVGWGLSGSGAAAAAHGCWSRASMGSSAVPGEEEAGYGGRRPGLFGLGADLVVLPVRWSLPATGPGKPMGKR